MTKTATGSAAAESLAPASPPGTATEPSREQPHFSYKPALDGLRAVAVLSVVAYHFGAGWLKGGFLGVDMFFVLSGYLITSLLLIEWARSDRIRFGAFWARRARRLLPALFLVLIAVALWGRIVQSSDQWGSLRSDSIWSLFYGANWHFVASGQSYFTAEPSMLRHMWSLAIEEQFYLLWPLIVFGCLKANRGRHMLLVSVCVVGSVASAMVMHATFTPGRDPSRAYFGTDARASQLLVGALLAIVLVHWAPRVRASRFAVQAAGVVGAIVVAAMFWAARDQGTGMYRGGFLLFAICTAALIAAIVQPTRNPLRGALSLGPVRWIGQVSYGVYLWHWPVAIALSASRLRGWGWEASGFEVAVIRLAATFAIAALSYYLVELPIRQRRFARRWTPRVLLPAGFAAVLVAIVLSTAGATENILSRAPGTVLRSGGRAPTATTVPGAAVVPTQRVLVLGDSVAASLGDALSTTAAGDGVTAQAVTRLGCGMTTGITLNDDGSQISWSPDCARSTVEYQQGAIDDVQPDTVLWLSTWELADYEVDGQHLRFGTRAWDAWMLTELERVRALATENGARLVLVQNPPNAPNPLRDVAPRDVERNEHLNGLFEEFATGRPGVGVVDLSTIVCPGGAPCPTTRDGIVLRPKDGGHYEADGAAWASRRLLDALYVALTATDAESTTPTTTPNR